MTKIRTIIDGNGVAFRRDGEQAWTSPDGDSTAHLDRTGQYLQIQRHGRETDIIYLDGDVIDIRIPASARPLVYYVTRAARAGSTTGLPVGIYTEQIWAAGGPPPSAPPQPKRVVALQLRDAPRRLTASHQPQPLSFVLVAAPTIFNDKGEPMRGRSTEMGYEAIVTVTFDKQNRRYALTFIGEATFDAPSQQIRADASSPTETRAFPEKFSGILLIPATPEDDPAVLVLKDLPFFEEIDPEKRRVVYRLASSLPPMSTGAELLLEMLVGSGEAHARQREGIYEEVATILISQGLTGEPFEQAVIRHLTERLRTQRLRTRTEPPQPSIPPMSGVAELLLEMLVGSGEAHAAARQKKYAEITTPLLMQRLTSDQFNHAIIQQLTKELKARPPTPPQQPIPTPSPQRPQPPPIQQPPSPMQPPSKQSPPGAEAPPKASEPPHAPLPPTRVTREAGAEVPRLRRAPMPVIPAELRPYVEVLHITGTSEDHLRYYESALTRAAQTTTLIKDLLRQECFNFWRKHLQREEKWIGAIADTKTYEDLALLFHIPFDEPKALRAALKQYAAQGKATPEKVPRKELTPEEKAAPAKELPRRVRIRTIPSDLLPYLQLLKSGKKRRRLLKDYKTAVADAERTHLSTKEYLRRKCYALWHTNLARDNKWDGLIQAAESYEDLATFFALSPDDPFALYDRLKTYDPHATARASALNAEGSVPRPEELTPRARRAPEKKIEAASATEHQPAQQPVAQESRPKGAVIPLTVQPYVEALTNADINAQWTAYAESDVTRRDTVQYWQERCVTEWKKQLRDEHRSTLAITRTKTYDQLARVLQVNANEPVILAGRIAQLNRPTTLPASERGGVNQAMHELQNDLTTSDKSLEVKIEYGKGSLPALELPTDVLTIRVSALLPPSSEGDKVRANAMEVVTKEITQKVIRAIALSYPEAAACLLFLHPSAQAKPLGGQPLFETLLATGRDIFGANSRATILDGLLTDFLNTPTGPDAARYHDVVQLEFVITPRGYERAHLKGLYQTQNRAIEATCNLPRTTPRADPQPPAISTDERPATIPSDVRPYLDALFHTDAERAQEEFARASEKKRNTTRYWQARCYKAWRLQLGGERRWIGPVKKARNYTQLAAVFGATGKPPALLAALVAEYQHGDPVTDVTAPISNAAASLQSELREAMPSLTGLKDISIAVSEGIGSRKGLAIPTDALSVRLTWDLPEQRELIDRRKENEERSERQQMLSESSAKVLAETLTILLKQAPETPHLLCYLHPGVEAVELGGKFLQAALQKAADEVFQESGKAGGVEVLITDFRNVPLTDPHYRDNVRNVQIEYIIAGRPEDTDSVKSLYREVNQYLLRQRTALQ